MITKRLAEKILDLILFQSPQILTIEMVLSVNQPHFTIIYLN